MTPIFYSRAGDPESHSSVDQVRRLILKMSVMGIGVTLLLSGIAMISHEMVLSFFVAEPYRGKSSFMPLIILSAGILQSSILLGTILTIFNKTKFILPLAIVGQSIIIFSNIIFTKFYGTNGLIYSMVGGSCVHMAWMFRTVMKHRRNIS
jgi:O-antigen/teichoic acid export membrane protein